MKAYLRLDPLIDESKSDYTPAQFGAFIKVLALATRQRHRGRFRSRKALAMTLPAAYVRLLPHLFSEGDLIEQEDGTVYVDGYDEWQEGDLTVAERMRRLRNRQRNGHRNAQRNAGRNDDVTRPYPPAIHVDVDSDADSLGTTTPSESRGRARGSGAAEGQRKNGANREADIARARSKLNDPKASDDVRQAAIARLQQLEAPLEAEGEADWFGEAPA